MKIQQRIFVSVIAPIVMLAGSFSTRSTQDKPLDIDSTKQLPYSQQAKTIPVSDLMITLKLNIDDKAPIVASQFDGGMIRIELLEKEGLPIYGFSPYISDPATGKISIRVFQINRIVKGGELRGEGMQEISTLDAYKENEKYRMAYASGEASFSFELVGVQKNDRFVEPNDYGDLAGEGQCCIVCNGVRSCACAVGTGCGSCCAPSCCG